MSFLFQSAFVTGATGLLGNNLVRELVVRGIRVKALVRSKEKAKEQFAGLPIETVEGDMRNVAGFAGHLRGVDVLFHTAAYFRDNFKGGRHRDDLYQINVLGTQELLSHAYSAGIRRIVHTSSASVLYGPRRGELINETMHRPLDRAEDYPHSKILSDREVSKFLKRHPDASACTVLPGWMMGPGDIGPTGAGQLILDFIARKLPGIPPAAFSVVDARDVADAHIAAALKGRRGEPYLVAGRHVEMNELMSQLESLTRVPSPQRTVPYPLLYMLAVANEVSHLITGKPTLISLAAVRFMATERDRTHFDSSKAERELGVRFRPLEATLRDTIAWYEEHGWCATQGPAQPQLRTAGDSL